MHSDPLEDQQTFLTREPSLQLLCWPLALVKSVHTVHTYCCTGPIQEPLCSSSPLGRVADLKGPSMDPLRLADGRTGGVRGCE